MVLTATVTSKGQVTLPKALRDALDIREGDVISFRVEVDHAVLVRPPNFVELAGTVEVPAEARNLTWSEVLDRTYDTPDR